MTTVFDVPAEPLLAKAAERLKAMEALKPPAWSAFVKTGRHRERPPTDPQWWWKRCAALLRKVYVHGPIGTEHLASMFGGSVDRGVKPDRAWQGSRSITRHALQQLEEAGLVITIKGKGRSVTAGGRRLLDAAAHEARPAAASKVPALAKY